MVRSPISAFILATPLPSSPPRRRPLLHNTPPTASAAVKKVASAAIATLAAAFLSCPTPTHISSLPPLAVLPAQAAKGGGASFLSASGDVIKDPESLLRWSLPISNRPVRELQTELEAVINSTRGLKWARIDGHLKRASMVLKNQSDSILRDVVADKVSDASFLLDTVMDEIPDVEGAAQKRSVAGVIKGAKLALENVGKVEELMVGGFPYVVPDEFSELPQLKGRATVDVVVKKANGEMFDIDGTLYKQGEMQLVLDGYNAPISAGTFVNLVDSGFYNGNAINRSDGFIIQAGKGKKDEDVKTIPLEVFARGDKEPTYGITLEDDGRGAVGTVLPFTSYGTLAMARSEVEPNSASTQFFWFLFEPDLTPAGRNLMDGAWAVFGYTTKGEQFLKGLEVGDQIVSAKVVQGLDNLVR